MAEQEPKNQSAKNSAEDLQRNIELVTETSKDEISAQADVFNQLDTKTGVVLGFALVAVAQVFTALLRLVAEQTVLHAKAPIFLSVLLVAGCALVLLATVFGAVARAPRDFFYGISFEDGEENKAPIQLRVSALKAYRDAIAENEKSNKSKARWARMTSYFVAGALACLVLATFFLYFSIPGVSY